MHNEGMATVPDRVAKRKKRRWPIYAGAALVVSAGLSFVFDLFPRQQRELRSGVRSAVEEAFPERAAGAAGSYGLIRYGEGPAGSTELDAAAPSVVLIHGLDDPGKVWRSLAPALSGMNVNVWQMTYPNDQPIADSSWFVFGEMKRLSRLGVEEIVIVAHSMGGLVSRELLTSPVIDYAEAAGAGDAPAAAGLIMVAPPNHGSQVARFRLLAEVREQWVNTVEGGADLLRGIFDGAGEANIDLIPDSEFLTTLNGRPQPEGVELLIVAGVVAPWAGDGLVSVDSTRLDGVEHRTVPGTHATMIRNLTEGSSRVPPAVPLIAETLGQWFSDRQP